MKIEKLIDHTGIADPLTEHDCPTCGEHFSTCVCESQPAPNKAQHSPDDDGKISRDDWRALAITRYADVERYRTHADKLAEALRKTRTCASLPDSVLDIVKQALAAYEAAQ